MLCNSVSSRRFVFTAHRKTTMVEESSVGCTAAVGHTGTAAVRFVPFVLFLTYPASAACAVLRPDFYWAIYFEVCTDCCGNSFKQSPIKMKTIRRQDVKTVRKLYANARGAIGLECQKLEVVLLLSCAVLSYRNTSCKYVAEYRAAGWNSSCGTHLIPQDVCCSPPPQPSIHLPTEFCQRSHDRIIEDQSHTSWPDPFP